MKKFFEHISPSLQLLLFIFLTLSCWLVVSVLAALVSISFWGTSVITNPENILNNVEYLKYFQVTQSIGLFILPPLIFKYVTKKKFISAQRIPINSMIILILITILVVGFAQPFVNFTGVINSGLELPNYLKGLESWMRSKELAAQQVTETFLSSTSFVGGLFNIIIIAILPAIGEELMFRGALQRIFEGMLKKKHWAVIITAILFSAMHIQFFGFLPRFLLGVIFGYLMLYSKNIWLPILAHFTNNFMAYIIYQRYLNDASNIKNPLDMSQNTPQVAWLLVSVGLTVGLVFLFKKVINQNNKLL